MRNLQSDNLRDALKHAAQPRLLVMREEYAETHEPRKSRLHNLAEGLRGIVTELAAGDVQMSDSRSTQHHQWEVFA